MVLIESPPRSIGVRQAFVRLGHEHHDRVGKAPARPDEQLKRPVEDGRVAKPVEFEREHLGQVLAEHGAPHLRLPRPEPVDVAVQRINLAVVREHPERLG